MSSDKTTLTASEFPLALFGLGLPLILAAFSLSGYRAPDNTAELLATGLAVLGLLMEMLGRNRQNATPLWLKAGIPALLVTWFFFSNFSSLAWNALDQLPLIMESRPLIFLMVTALWLTIFPPPTPKQITFWASWLAILICLEFGCRFFLLHQPAAPSLFGLQIITGPLLLAGLCSSLHNPDENTFSRLFILAGIFCSLGRDTILASVIILLISGPRGGLKKTLIIIAMLLFNYLSLSIHEMNFMNRQDLPSYWLWFSVLELFAHNPDLLLTGFSLSTPLPLNVPASLWTLWHGQQQLWTGSGIYLFHVLPFWLHLLSAWGIAGPCAAAAAGTALYRKFPSAMMGSLMIAVFFCGFFSPLLYTPACALFIFSTLIAATQPEFQTFRFE